MHAAACSQWRAAAANAAVHWCVFVPALRHGACRFQRRSSRACRRCSNSSGELHGLKSFFIVDNLAAVVSVDPAPPPQWAKLCGVVEGFCEGRGEAAGRPQVHRLRAVGCGSYNGAAPPVLVGHRVFTCLRQQPGSTLLFSWHAAMTSAAPLGEPAGIVAPAQRCMLSSAAGSQVLVRRVLTAEDAADTPSHDRDKAEGQAYRDLREPLLRLDLAWGVLHKRPNNSSLPRAVAKCERLVCTPRPTAWHGLAAALLTCCA